MRPITGTPVTRSLRISRESLAEHAADAAAACCHNAGTARIHPLAETGISGHRRTAPHAIRACARHTHLGHLLNREAGQPCRPPPWPHTDHPGLAGRIDPVRCLTMHKAAVCALADHVL